MKAIFEYFDYRQLLKDLFDQQKQANRYFSYRVLGELVGFTSAGFFTKILQGTVNISSKNALAFAKSFRMTKTETRYFQLLVMFNQGKTHEERRYYFEQLISLRRTKIKELTTDQYELFSEWYYVVIREMLAYYPFRGDYGELARLLRPAILPNDAKRAIETLEKLGLIRKHADGRYASTNEVISTGESWVSLAVTNFQLKTTELAGHAIQFIPKEQREISTLTLSISPATFEIFREKIRSLHNEMFELSKKDSGADRIYHMNLQLFPVSKPYSREKDVGRTPAKKKGRTSKNGE